MKNFFSGLARLFALIFAVLFVVSMVAALILFNVQSRALDANTYKSVLEAQGIYNRLPTLLAEQIHGQLKTTDCEGNPLACLQGSVSNELSACLQKGLGESVTAELMGNARQPNTEQLATIKACFDVTETALPQTVQAPAYLRFLNTQDWETLIRVLLPERQIQPLVSSSLDRIFDFLNNNSTYASIPLGDLKNSLTRQGLAAITKLLGEHESCTLEQGLQLGDLLADLNLTDQQTNFLCNPSVEILTAISPVIEAGVRAQIASLPNEIPVFTEKNKDIQEKVSMARAVMLLSPLLPLVLLLLITLLRVKSFQGWLRWWGFPLTFAGILTFGLCLGLGPLTQSQLAIQLSRIPAITPTLSETILKVVDQVIKSITGPIIFQAVLFGLLGLGMVTLSFFSEDWLDEPTIPVRPSTTLPLK